MTIKYITYFDLQPTTNILLFLQLVKFVQQIWVTSRNKRKKNCIEYFSIYEKGRKWGSRKIAFSQLRQINWQLLSIFANLDSRDCKRRRIEKRFDRRKRRGTIGTSFPQRPVPETIRRLLDHNVGFIDIQRRIKLIFFF